MRLIVFFTSFIIATMSFAESLDFRDIVEQRNIRTIKINYRTRKNESLANIYRKFVKDNSVISRREPMVKKTFKKNDHVKNWDKIPKGTKIKIYVDVDFIDFDKINGFSKKLAKQISKEKEEIKEIRDIGKEKTRYRGSLFYMASFGQFTQENDNIDVSFNQNSPITLGFAGSWYPANSNFSVSTSLYFSNLLAASSNLDVSDISIPLEIGGNTYLEYRYNKLNTTFYAGLDYETFSTFNMQGLSDDPANPLVFVDDNKVGYFTLGIAKRFTMFRKEFFSKISFSHSLTSSRDVGYSAATDTSSFEGNKVLIYLFKSINRKWFAHGLFKYHWMDGPSSITTLRVGVGFGYLLF